MMLNRTTVLLAAAFFAVAHAEATTLKTGEPAASQPGAENWATRDHLRECLATEAALKERARAIDASTAAHDKMLEQVEAENKRLEQLQSQLDTSSERSVKAFNAAAKEHNQHVKALNQDAADSQPATDAYNADRVAFNQRCSGQRYRAEDLDAVTRERQKTAAPAASASL